MAKQISLKHPKTMTAREVSRVQNLAKLLILFPFQHIYELGQHRKPMSSFENPSRLLFVLDCLSVFGAYCGTYLRDSEGFKLHGKMENMWKVEESVKGRSVSENEFTVCPKNC